MHSALHKLDSTKNPGRHMTNLTEHELSHKYGDIQRPLRYSVEILRSKDLLNAEGEKKKTGSNNVVMSNWFKSRSVKL